MGERERVGESVCVSGRERKCVSGRERVWVGDSVRV